MMILLNRVPTIYQADDANPTTNMNAGTLPTVRNEYMNTLAILGRNRNFPSFFFFPSLSPNLFTLLYRV